MKGKITFKSFIFLCTILFTIQIAAQTVDTLVVEAEPVGNINNVINGDTTSTGERINPNRVYLLKNNGESHSTFYITEPILIKDLKLIGESNPNTKFPPVIAPNINEDNSSVSTFIKIEQGGIIDLQNLYLLGTRTDNISKTYSAVSTIGDSVTFNLDHCIFENFGATGTSNILNTWNAIGNKIIIANSLFRNNQSNVPHNPGMNWAGPRVNAIDTMLVTNSTFFVFGGCITGTGSSIGYLKFDHNTIFMQTKSSPFFIHEMHNAKITNNIFYSVYSAGLDSFHVHEQNVSSANWYSAPAIIELDSLCILRLAPYYLTESDRNISAKHNAYFWPQGIIDNFNTLNTDEKYQIIGGKILPPVWVATNTYAESLLYMPNLQITEDENYNIDPNFDLDLVNEATETMTLFVRYIWENADGGDLKPFVNPANPNSIYKNVSANWAKTQGYPVPENLNYNNDILKNGSTDELPLGDINWIPEYIVDVNKTQEQIPNSFELYQNYPNPFNPITKIKYQLAQSALVTLEVFNLLGERIEVLVDKKQNAGEYIIDFKAVNLSSGIFIYRLKADKYFKVRKMLLLR